MIAIFRRRSRRFDERFRQAAELIGGDVGDIAFFVMKNVVRELRVKLGEFLVDRGVALFRFARQRRAVMGETVIDEPNETLLVRPQ